MARDETLTLRMRTIGIAQATVELHGVERGIQGVDRQSRRARASTRLLSGAMSGLQRSAQAVRYAVGAAALALGGFAALGIKNGIALNQQWESLTAQFHTLTGSGAKARKLMEDMRRVTAESPLRLTQVLDAGRGLLAAGMKAARLPQVMAAIQNAALVAGGDPGEKLGRISEVLAQVQAQGKIYADDINQLTAAGINVRRVLRKELHLSGKEVANIGEEGVRAHRVITALTRAWTSGSMGEAAERMSETFEGQRNILMKQLEQLQRLLTAGLFKRLRGALKDVTRATGLAITAFQEGGFEAMLSSFDRSFSTGGRILGTFKALESAVGDLGAMVRDWLLPAGKAVVGWLSDLPKGVKIAAAALTGVLMVAFGGPVMIIAALVAGLTLLHKHWGAVTRAIGVAIRWLGARLGITADDMRAAWRVISDAARAVAAIFRGAVLPTILRVLDGIVTALEGLALVVGGVVKVISGILTGDFGRAWSGVKQIFSGGLKAIWGLVKAATAPFRTAADLLWDGFTAGAKAAFGAAKRMVVGILNWLIRRYNTAARLLPGIDPVNEIATFGPELAAGGKRVRPLKGANREFSRRLFDPSPLLAGASAAGGGDLVVPITVTADGKPIAKVVHRQGLKAKAKR